MKTGKIIFIDRYIDTSWGDTALSMAIAIERKNIFGKTVIDKRDMYGFVNSTLKVGDEVYYHFDKWGMSKSYVLKKEEK